GAQGVGHVPIHPKEFGIDFMAFPAWKWLLGPLGLGAMYVNSERIEELTPIFKGTGSVKGGENYLPYKSEWKDGAGRYEFSTPNFIDWIYFKAILEKLDEIGFEKIQKRLYELSSYLGNGLKEIGFEISLDTHKENSGILVAYHKKKTSTEIVTHLRKEDVFTADRLGGVRFAPHIYNSENQLDEIVQLLKRII
ncbi:MAG: aminotransferase class V-fold PLP-dependent enzyme, partial [Leptospiraceae bacterium]|nr:aminotransferase class V-fold PLP-dependent enzyme [Leptospiraceae bacterium]